MVSMGNGVQGVCEDGEEVGGLWDRDVCGAGCALGPTAGGVLGAKCEEMGPLRGLRNGRWRGEALGGPVGLRVSVGTL